MLGGKIFDLFLWLSIRIKKVFAMGAEAVGGKSVAFEEKEGDHGC